MATNQEFDLNRYLAERLGRTPVLQNQNANDGVETNVTRARRIPNRGTEEYGEQPLGGQSRANRGTWVGNAGRIPNRGTEEYGEQSRGGQACANNGNRGGYENHPPSYNFAETEAGEQPDGSQGHGEFRRNQGAPRHRQRTPHDLSQTDHLSFNNEGTSASSHSTSGTSTPTRPETMIQMDPFSMLPECTSSVDSTTQANVTLPKDNEQQSDTSDMCFQKLEKFTTMESEQVVLILKNEETGFDKLLKTDLLPDYIVLLLRIINKLCESAFNKNKGRLLVKFCQKKFIDKLILYVNNLLHQDDTDKEGNKYFWEQSDQFWNNLLTFYECVITLVPNTAVECFPNLIKATHFVALNMGDRQQMPVQEHVKEKLRVLLEKIILCQEERTNEKQVVISATEKKPEKFREISLYPLVSEVTSSQHDSVRWNIIHGGYTSVDHYLDVQFRLLREDFVAPLRFGICTYIQKECDKEKERQFNVRSYPKVHFIKKDYVQDKVVVIVQFHPDPTKKRLKLEYSKRFMYGSLVCFTKDDFKNIIFGTIAKRDLKLLKEGKVTVEIWEDVVFDEDYIMVESSVYFEPCFYMLRALQLFDEQTFPMKKYIVDAQPEPWLPSYLSPLSIYSYMGFTFSPLNLSSWPIANDLELDPSQYQAFQAAMTREFLAIEGAPGTGKTYLGLKIVDIFLKNFNLWRRPIVEKGTYTVKYVGVPILVICFTNRTLDKFLGGILKYTDKLIRVGGQSSNAALNKYNIKNVRFQTEQQRVSHNLVYHKRDEILKCMRDMSSFQNVLNMIAKKTSVLDFDNFRVIDKRLQRSWFMKATKKQRLEWLLGGRTAEDIVKDQQTIAFVQAQIQSAKNEQLNDDSDSEEFFDADDEAREREVDDRNILFSLRDNGVCTYLVKDISPAMEAITDDMKYLQMRLGQYTRNKHLLPHPSNYWHPEKMQSNDRWSLYFYWLDNLQVTWSKHLTQLEDQYRKLYREFEEAKKNEDIRIMKDVDVLGMTSSAAVRYQATLQALKCPIVIIEEAAEVLESNIVVSLTKQCKQLILIGDDQELSHTTSEHSLATDYYRKISLFERMKKNYIHLQMQYRMRPEIFRLIRPTIYQKLKNHISVESYPPVTGMDKNVFFITHTELEEVSNSGSKRNIHEAKFLIRLARHLILQGYESSDITILATYSAQIFCLCKERKNFPQLGKVHITSVDHFQREENKIILLSLVRSNNSDDIGNLKIDKQVNVALSRAKEGLFIIGNMDTLQKSNNVWQKLKAVLEEEGAIGTHLLLRCQMHPDQVTLVAKADDFHTVSEGGCSKICGRLLVCGHKCPILCHITDKMHKQYKCKKMCNRLLCEYEHHCPNYCFEKCKPCEVSLELTLLCNHIHKLPCKSRDQLDKYQCPTIVSVELECGHKIDKPCYKRIEDFPCQHPCEIRLDCGHTCTRKCHINNDPDHIQTKCYKPCAKRQTGCSLNHICPLKCHESCPPCCCSVTKKRSKCDHTVKVRCQQDPDQVACNKICNKTMECGHICRNLCNEPCTNCPEMVKKTIVECGHTIETKCCEKAEKSKCEGKCPLELPCGHPCTNRCFESCNTECRVLTDHQVTADCGHVLKVPCYQKDQESLSNLLLSNCNEPCNTILKCGHKCSGTCNECKQGRMHKRCQIKCSHVLICGHDCELPCGQACEPCTKMCTFSCAHSKCDHICGMPCSKCMEQCPRRCPHTRCSKKCSELCDCKPCGVPCPNPLKCGHPCLGYCGDICPPLCRVCDPENNAFELFFGHEAVENARFIYLEDCQHTIEDSAMKQWLSQDNASEINLKACPKCKTRIIKHQRYCNYVKTAHQDMNAIKCILYGNLRENEENRDVLIKRLDILKNNNHFVYKSSEILHILLQKLKTSLTRNENGIKNSVNIVFLKNCRTQIELLEMLLTIFSDTGYKNIYVIIRAYTRKCLNKLDFLLRIVYEWNNQITDQEIADMECEINRFGKFVKLHIVERDPEFVKARTGVIVKTLCDSITQKLESVHKFTDTVNQEVDTLIKQLNKEVDRHLKLTDEEREMIVKAIGLPKGHWYKCPNGHFYCIDQKGAPIQILHCYECRELIGGQGNILLCTNKHAGEMDGSSHPAWP